MTVSRNSASPINYQCRIFERMEGWAEGLGLKYSVTPQLQGCMMHTEGRCFREFHFEFGEE